MQFHKEMGGGELRLFNRGLMVFESTLPEERSCSVCKEYKHESYFYEAHLVRTGGKIRCKLCWNEYVQSLPGYKERFNAYNKKNRKVFSDYCSFYSQGKKMGLI